MILNIFCVLQKLAMILVLLGVIVGSHTLLDKDLKKNIYGHNKLVAQRENREGKIVNV